MGYKLLILNTGSTSTKCALYQDGITFEKSIVHSQEALNRCSCLDEQYDMRLQAVKNVLRESGRQPEHLDAVAARGGTFGYAQGGAYLIEENLLNASRHPITNHPSNLSAVLASAFAAEYGCSGYIYDAVCVNEVRDIARVTGLHDVLRRPFSHVLNTRAVARHTAQKLGLAYEEANFVVAHLGGGVSINVHDHGKIVDLVCDDDGPMSPERAGKLNGKAYADLCFSGRYDKASFMKRIKGRGGLIDHLGTSDLREIDHRIDAGDEHALFILNAMGYQAAKDIAALSAVVYGKVDRIILTGGGAFCDRLVRAIRERVAYIAPVEVVPGSMEMEALAQGVLRVLDGAETAKIYGRELQQGV